MDANAKPYDDSHFLIQEEGGIIAVAMLSGDLLEYVIPTEWESRYEKISSAILELVAIAPELVQRVGEDRPSHAAWYAALLPSLGFEMTPRMRLSATVTELLSGTRRSGSRIATSMMDRSFLDECIELHVRAFDLPVGKKEEMEENLRSSIELSDRLGSWSIMRSEGTLVGSCFGSEHRGKLFIEELAVDRAHRNQGLGWQLLLQTVEKLTTVFPDASTVVLDVDRTNRAACHLYASLGFRPSEFYTVAQITKRSRAAESSSRPLG